MLPSNPSRAVVVSQACRSLKPYRVHSLTSDRPASCALPYTAQRRLYITIRSRRPWTRTATSAIPTCRRHRSNFGPFWARDVRSFWHRPGCTWVHSEGDPRSAPRDKECPACQCETDRPLELSLRELMWERQSELMRQYVHRDPYDALFGRSNERLRKFVSRASDEEELTRPWFAKWSGEVTRWSPKETNSEDQGQVAKIKDTGKESGVKSELSKPSISTSPKQDRPSSAPLAAEKPAYQSSSAEFGHDESVFDPITMRRVPKRRPRDAAPNVKGMQEKDIAVDIPVKTFAVFQPVNVEPVTPTVQTRTTEEPNIPEDLPTAHKAAYKQQNTDLLDSHDVDGREARTAPSHLTSKEFLSSLRHDFNNSKSIPGADQPRVNNWDTGPAHNLGPKEALEASWVKERELRQKATRADAPEPRTAKIDMDEQDFDEWNEIAHFRRAAATLSSDVEKRSYISNHKRDRPFKHMNSNELNAHRATLLASFAKKQSQKPAVDTPADKLLNAEVDAQKAAMRAFENKPHNVASLGSEKASDLAESTVNAKAGEASSQVSVVAKEKAEDKALVHEIKGIYEDAYGVIGAQDEQDTLKNSLREYERGLPPREYDFIMDQDNLEQELRDQGKTLESGYEEPTYYDKRLGPSAYRFKTGQDNLEQELKAASERHQLDEPLIRVTRANREVHHCMRRLQHFYNTLANVEAPKPATEPPHLTKHLAPGSQQSAPAPQPATPLPPTQSPSIDRHLYQILAYDPTDQSIYPAAASSSFSPPTGETVIPLSDALSRLYAPAKFLPHLANHQLKGYEVVSASKNLLVLKRMRPADAVAVVEADAAGAATIAEPMANLKAPNEATESSSVSYPPPPYEHTAQRDTAHTHTDTARSAPSAVARKRDPTSPRSTRRVRKEEPVFSGTQRRWDDTAPAASSTSAPAAAVAESAGANTSAGSTGGTPPPSNTTGTGTDNASNQQQHQQQQQQQQGPPNTSPATRFRSLTFTALVAGNIVILCYFTGFIIEDLRARQEPNFVNSSTGPTTRGSHSSHASYAPGATDRAMWVAHVEKKKKRGAEPLAEEPARKREGRSRREYWDAGCRYGGVGGADAVGNRDEGAGVPAATVLGMTLCVVSAVGLLLGIGGGE